jgi:hypothetical protein
MRNRADHDRRTQIRHVKTALLASLLLLHAAQAASGADLGRLFHTPEQRKALDAARANPPQPQKPAAVAPARNAEPARLDGYVARSSGPSTVWIDGRAVRVSAKER